MKKHILELTEGMQRLCAVANRVVATEGKVSRIERDLLLDDLRRLYDVALLLDVDDEPLKADEPTVTVDADEEMLSSAMVATMAAMAAEPAVVAAEAVEAVADEPVLPEVVVAPAEPAAEPEAIVPEVEDSVDEEVALQEPAVVEIEMPAIEPAPAVEPAPEQETPSMAAYEADNSLLFEMESVEIAPEPVVEESESQPVEVEGPTAPAAVEAAQEVAPEPAAPRADEGRPSSLMDYLRRPVQEQPTMRTLGERFGDGRSVASEGLVKKVSDLRTVININDKFSFMSELFDNSLSAYTAFIMHLNELTSREEALAYVDEVRARYGWNSESATVQTFQKIFDMKF